MGLLTRLGGVFRSTALTTPAPGRLAAPSGKRFYGTRGPAMAYEAAAPDGLIPTVPDLGPLDEVRYQRLLLRIARQLHRNDAWIRALVRVLGDNIVGTGPVPRSRHQELADLFVLSAQSYDLRGVQSWGSFIREDVAQTRLVDGESFIKAEVDFEDVDPDDPSGMPIRYQSLTTDFVPVELMRAEPNGDRTIAGIQFRARPDGRPGDRRRGYWVYPEHPRNVTFGAAIFTPEFVPANELMHYHAPAQPGAPRGEIILASALLRAIKLASYQDAELKRKITATLLSLFIERPLDANSDDSLVPDEETVQSLIDMIDLQPGGVYEVPNGYKANFQVPPDTPGNYIPSVRFQIMQICASVGVPMHEITHDYENLSDRTLKFAAIGFKRRAEIERDRIESQVLQVMWRRHVDVSIATGRWRPPPGRPLWEAYQVEWQWPVLQLANLNQELGTMMTAVEKGILDRDTVSQTYFGLRTDTMDRRQAESAARAAELGLLHGAAVWGPTSPTAQRIAATAAAQESAERDQVDADNGADTSLGAGVQATVDRVPEA